MITKITTKMFRAAASRRADPVRVTIEKLRRLHENKTSVLFCGMYTPDTHFEYTRGVVMHIAAPILRFGISATEYMNSWEDICQKGRDTSPYRHRIDGIHFVDMDKGIIWYSEPFIAEGPWSDDIPVALVEYGPAKTPKIMVLPSVAEGVDMFKVQLRQVVESLGWEYKKLLEDDPVTARDLMDNYANAPCRITLKYPKKSLVSLDLVEAISFGKVLVDRVTVE